MHEPKAGLGDHQGERASHEEEEGKNRQSFRHPGHEADAYDHLNGADRQHGRPGGEEGKALRHEIGDGACIENLQQAEPKRHEPHGPAQKEQAVGPCRLATAFKVVMFMPMAISFLAAGVIFRLVYEHDPERGVANAVVTGIVDAVREPGPYSSARPRNTDLLRPDGKAYVTSVPFSPGSTAELGLVGMRPDLLPSDARPAMAPTAPERGVAGVVWLDFSPGGGGRPGLVDPAERGLPEARVEALDGQGAVKATAVTDESGQFRLGELEPGSYRLRLAESSFRQPFGGVRWLGPALVTPAVIGSYVWIWSGFAMVVIAAGLAAIPRDVLEAARVDGASEWQVFRRVTVPLLRPVLVVVFVTLVINVLKVFDLVFVIPPGSVQDDANVVALEMWRVSFGGARDQGLGSALAVLLFLLVVPAMAFNVRRFRREAAV